MHLKLVFCNKRYSRENYKRVQKLYKKIYILYNHCRDLPTALSRTTFSSSCIYRPGFFNGNHLLEYIIKKKISLLLLLSWVDWVIVFNLWNYLRHLFVNLFLHVWFLRQYPHNAPIFHAFPKCDIRNFFVLSMLPEHRGNIKSTKKVGK